jgi:hypothetical protein
LDQSIIFTVDSWFTLSVQWVRNSNRYVYKSRSSVILDDSFLGNVCLFIKRPRRFGMLHYSLFYKVQILNQVNFIIPLTVNVLLRLSIIDTFMYFYLFNNFIGAINYFKIISSISTGPKGKVRTRLYRSPMQGTSLL